MKAARAFASKCGVLVHGGKRRVAVLLKGRLLVFKERPDEKHGPVFSSSLLLCALDLNDAELRVGALRLRGDDRRDALAWLLLLRESKVWGNSSSFCLSCSNFLFFFC